MTICTRATDNQVNSLGKRKSDAEGHSADCIAGDSPGDPGRQVFVFMDKGSMLLQRWR